MKTTIYCKDNGPIYESTSSLKELRRGAPKGFVKLVKGRITEYRSLDTIARIIEEEDSEDSNEVRAQMV